MKVFSSRYRQNSVVISKLAQAGGVSRKTEAEASKFLNPKLRNKLVHVVSYVCSSKKFLEPFLILENEKNSTFYLHAPSLKAISKAEFGYDITDSFNPTTLELEQPFLADVGYQSNDLHLMDLIELLLVFSKDDKRDDVRSRFQRVLEDENFPMSILDWMLLPSVESGIMGIAPLLKNGQLQDKIRALYPYSTRQQSDLSPEAAARMSADITQYVLSSEKGQKKTKVESEALIQSTAAAWTTPEKSAELADLLDRLAALTKDFNNRVSDVRHTDKHTIATSSAGIYDVIFNLNYSLSELLVTTNQNKFIEGSSAEELKKQYLEQYSIRPQGTWIIKRDPDGIDLSEIPF